MTDWQEWIKQKLPVTEIQRGGATVWPKGADRLIGDALGPVMHLHDDASEIFYFISGTCRLEIGNSEEILEAGDFILVPPEVPHNLWNAGNDDLLVFWIVAPNFINNKWRTDSFPPGAMERRALRARVEPGVTLPSDDKIRSQLLSLSPQSAHHGQTRSGEEAIIYVTEGLVQVQVGHLSGSLANNEFVHVPVETAFSVASSESQASFIQFNVGNINNERVDE